MSKEIDWSKAPEGYPIWIEDLRPDVLADMGGWHRDEEDRYVDETGKFWNKPEDGFYRVYRNPNESWTGQGLPPVGTVCEACVSGMGSWFKCSVLIHHPYEDGVAGVHDTVGHALLWTDTFRPVRTQAQIEAEEREKSVAGMLDKFRFGEDKQEILRTVCFGLYDAGYRKTEADK